MSANVLGIVIIALVATFVVYLLVSALRRRSLAMRQLRGPLAGGDPSARAPGSAAEVVDGGQVPVSELFSALRVAEVPELDAEGEPNDVAGLGLKLYEGETSTSSGQAGRPQVMM